MEANENPTRITESFTTTSAAKLKQNKDAQNNFEMYDSPPVGNPSFIFRPLQCEWVDDATHISTVWSGKQSRLRHAALDGGILPNRHTVEDDGEAADFAWKG